jgi:hypothetical protein
METTLNIVMIQFFKSLVYLRYRAVREVVDSREIDLMTKRQKESNIVHKEDVGCQKNLLVEL